MKSFWYMYCSIIFFLVHSTVLSQLRVRDEVQFPDISGYVTLACDFHTHTVFSDGDVWPTVRSEEAWRNGLDAIAITDHIEYLPHKDDIRTNHNRAHELAEPLGHALGLLVIKGSEITRKMPPGHLNAIFLKDASKIETETWRDALKAAHDQGAFIFWNHPGWSGQQPDGVSRWYPEHTELVENDMMHGMEVVNYKEYYPEVHQWCLDKDLTMLSNSDIHAPIYMDYDFGGTGLSPVTLVFASEKSKSGIKEALFARRTVVYFNNMLIGRATFLEPLFMGSIRIENTRLDFTERNSVFFRIANNADIDYTLELPESFAGLTLPKNVTLYAHRTNLIALRKAENNPAETSKIKIPATVSNLLVEPEQGLAIELVVEAEF